MRQRLFFNYRIDVSSSQYDIRTVQIFGSCHDLSRDATVFKSVAHLLKTTNAVTLYSTLKVAILRLYSNAGGP